ncbi:MAG: TetR-like C-terminal domain-containing protein [Actinomycetota bacterium]|nr:TetR-like C-terminal domain-containing protein [Actinomycetota bacterium]
MGRKAGIALEDVVATAARIADRDGLEAATLTAVAGELGIKTPSLYNHVDGLPGLRRLLAILGARILLEEFKAAAQGLDGTEALRAIASADRQFAIEHPGLYESFLPAPTEEEDPELYSEMAAPAFLVAHYFLDMGIPQGEAIHLVRALRALLHGFLDLEAKQGFGMPVDIQASFNASVELILAGVKAAAD